MFTCSVITLTLPASMGGSARSDMAGDADPLPLAAGTTMDQADSQLHQGINAFVQISLECTGRGYKSRTTYLQNGDAAAAAGDGDGDDENGEADISNAMISMVAPSFVV